MATKNLIEEFDKPKKPVKVAVKNKNPDFSTLKDKDELYAHMYAAHANYYKSQSLADKMSSDRKILGVPYKSQSNLEKILSDKSNKNWETIKKIEGNSYFNEKDYFDYRDKKDKIPKELTYYGTDGARNARTITVRPYEKTGNYIPYTTDIGTRGVIDYNTYEKVRRNYIVKNKK